MAWVVVFVMVLFLAPLILAAAKPKRTSRQNGRALANIAGFVPAVSFNGYSGHPGIAIDPSSRKLAITTTRGAPSVFAFNDIVAAEVVKNGNILTATNRGSQVAGAAIGAVLLGPAGLLLGALTGSRRSVEKVSRLSIKIYTNDLERPVHEVVFFDVPGSGLKANSPLVTGRAKVLDEWYGRLRTILYMNSRAAA